MNGKHVFFNRTNAVPVITGLFLVAVVLFYAVTGSCARFAVHDDLDLFPSQYMILKNTGTFFKHGVNVPFLGGIDRDYLPSELSLVSVCYMLFPGLAAHVAMYVCKVMIAVASFYLLAHELVMNGSLITAMDRKTGKMVEANTKSRAAFFADAKDRIMLCGFAYGVLNLFPHFGIAFASVPLVLFLLLKIGRCTTLKEAKWWYAPLFLYPFVSYFSYFGFFILLFLALFILSGLLSDAVRTVRDIRGGKRRSNISDEGYYFESHEEAVSRRFSVTLTAALAVLAAGYVVFEYRLFRVMLFSGVPTIRNTMARAEADFGDALAAALDLFINGNMHTTSIQKYFVMPVCMVYIALIIIRYSVPRFLAKRARAADGEGEAAASKLTAEPVQPLHAALLTVFALLLLFCLIGGLSVWEPFGNAVESVFPFLKGFQFGRMYFFNPFLWYAMLGMVVCCVGKTMGTVMVIIACVVALLAPVPYNSLLYTAYEQVYRISHDGAPTDNLTYEDFYATKLFDTVKEETGYDARDFAAAYGLYPSVLQYNGISTIDGYLGYYPLAYKPLFRAVIAPALAENETARDYFDRFGARCYLYAAHAEQDAMQYRMLEGFDEGGIYADAGALKELGCRYVFSRVSLSNAKEAGLELAYAFEEAGQPFPLYVYVVE